MELSSNTSFFSFILQKFPNISDPEVWLDTLYNDTHKNLIFLLQEIIETKDFEKDDYLCWVADRSYAVLTKNEHLDQMTEDERKTVHNCKIIFKRKLYAASFSQQEDPQSFSNKKTEKEFVLEKLGKVSEMDASFSNSEFLELLQFIQSSPLPQNEIRSFEQTIQKTLNSLAAPEAPGLYQEAYDEYRSSIFRTIVLKLLNSPFAHQDTGFSVNGIDLKPQKVTSELTFNKDDIQINFDDFTETTSWATQGSFAALPMHFLEQSHIVKTHFFKPEYRKFLHLIQKGIDKKFIPEATIESFLEKEHRDNQYGTCYGQACAVMIAASNLPHLEIQDVVKIAQFEDEVFFQICDSIHVDFEKILKNDKRLVTNLARSTESSRFQVSHRLHQLEMEVIEQLASTSKDTKLCRLLPYIRDLHQKRQNFLVQFKEKKMNIEEQLEYLRGNQESDDQKDALSNETKEQYAIAEKIKTFSQLIEKEVIDHIYGLYLEKIPDSEISTKLQELLIQKKNKGQELQQLNCFFQDTTKAITPIERVTKLKYLAQLQKDLRKLSLSIIEETIRLLRLLGFEKEAERCQVCLEEMTFSLEIILQLDYELYETRKRITDQKESILELQKKLQTLKTKEFQERTNTSLIQRTCTTVENRQALIDEIRPLLLLTRTPKCVEIALKYQGNGYSHAACIIVGPKCWMYDQQFGALSYPNIEALLNDFSGYLHFHHQEGCVEVELSIYANKAKSDVNSSEVEELGEVEEIEEK